MIIDMPATTSAQVNQKLVELRERGGAVALGRVLTLVIVDDEAAADDDDELENAIAAANDASREHPCRIIVVARGSAPSPQIDGQVRVGGDAGASEVIVLRLSGELGEVPESAVIPLLLPDAPIVTWWPRSAPASVAGHPLGTIAQRRITDAAADHRPVAALRARAAHYVAGDTDLAWSRLTRWRAQLVSALDHPPAEPVTAVEVTGETGSASTELLAGWLAEYLRVPVRRIASADPGITAVALERPSGAIRLHRTRDGVGTLAQPGELTRTVGLRRRSVPETLREELRRLDPDEVYERALDGLALLPTYA